MDVFSKLRSTVTNTVSQISGVLPGNPVTREFEVTSHICSAGPGLLWKVYQGYKKSTKQEASIFVFEKKSLERWPRESRDVILESMKRGVMQLTKLRHPQILIVQHPLEESRESLAFATEPVLASLANVLGNTENMPSSHITQLKDFKLSEVEIKYGLLQVAEGLAFLHNDVKLLHHNICPEVMILNHQGAWKIFGFDFCVHNDSKSDGQPSWPMSEYSEFVAHVAQPNLDYLAPEHGLAGAQSPASDMFSLGMLIYAVYNDGHSVIRYNEDWRTYKSRITELKNLHSAKLNNIPQGLRDLEKMLLHTTPELRPDAHQFTKIDFFEDVGVKTLNYLDSLFQLDELQKSQFYKGLPPIIQNFPHRVRLLRVVSCIGKEFANPSMVPFVLPCILQIAETCTQEEYMAHIFPRLVPAMKMTEPIQVLLIFMQKMELLLKLTPCDEIKSDVLPMLYRALESDAQQIQELCLSVLPTYSTLIDYPAMKNALLPRIKRLCINSPYTSVRVNCLVCIGKLLDNLDKWLVLDEILPFLPQIPSKEPAVLMGILGIYKITLTHKKLGIPKEIIAGKVVPFLMPLTIENGLTLNQFNTLFAVLKDMISRVESEHRSKLEQLNAISQQTNMITTTKKSNSETVSQNISGSKTDLDSLFSSLQVANPTDGPNSSSAPALVTSLTMEEKQRLMKQQESHQLFSQQTPIIHPTSAPVKTKIAPKDLTDTLLESNLNEMKWSSHTTSPPAPTPSVTPFPNSMSPGSSQFGTTMWRPGPFPPSLTGTQLTLNNSPAGYAQQRFPTQPMFGNSVMAASSNFSMLSPANYSNVSQQTTKPLSTSEINDLLS